LLYFTTNTLLLTHTADNDFFLYPHLDYDNKRDPQQRRPMMPRAPGAVDRRKRSEMQGKKIGKKWQKIDKKMIPSVRR
jgi:hypothetical protein